MAKYPRLSALLLLVLPGLAGAMPPTVDQESLEHLSPSVRAGFEPVLAQIEVLDAQLEWRG